MAPFLFSASSAPSARRVGVTEVGNPMPEPRPLGSVGRRASSTARIGPTDVRYRGAVGVPTLGARSRSRLRQAAPLYPLDRRRPRASCGSNATLTSVTDGVYTNITLTGFVADAITERFTLTNTTNVIWTYIDSKPFTGVVHVSISGLKTGSTANYRFTVSINGAIPVFASAVYIPME